MSTCMKPYFGINNFFQSYIKSIGPLNTITIEQERILLSEFWGGDDKALEKLCISFQYIVIEEALRSLHPAFELQDLIQEANLALVISLRRYSYDKGMLKAYLQRNVYLLLDNYTKNNLGLIRFPVNVIAELETVNGEIDNYFLNSNEELSYSKLEEYIRERQLNFDFVYLYYDDYFQVFFNQLIFLKDIDIDQIEANYFPSPDQSLLWESLQSDIHTVCSTLTKREAEIILLYFGINNDKEQTLQEIGDRFNFTRERARQILSTALTSIRSLKRGAILRDHTIPSDENIYKIKSNTNRFANIYEDQDHCLDLLKSYIKPRKRISLYPEIENLSEECRKLIPKILDEIGRPTQMEVIVDLIREKYPQINVSIISYALKTCDRITKIGKGIYALKNWDYFGGVDPISKNQFDRKELKNNIVEILNKQTSSISFEYLLAQLSTLYKSREFNDSEEKIILKTLANSENVIRTLDSKYYLIKNLE